MAAEPFNSAGGYTVGIPPVSIIDDNGNITAPYANISGNIDVGGSIVAVGNVTANAICPSSYVYKERAKAFYEKNKSYYSGIKSCIPSKNFTQVEEIATLVNFLMIKASTSINGQQFMLDGGLSVLDQSHLIDKFIPLDDKF